MLKAIVISPNDKTGDLGCLLAIARSEARRREHMSVNPPVRALVFVAELGVYVAVYKVLVEGKSVRGNSVIGVSGNQKVGSEKSKQEGC